MKNPIRRQSPKIVRRSKEHVAVATLDPLHPGRIIYLVPIQHKAADPEPAPAIIDSADYERIYREETCDRLWFAKKARPYEYVTIKSKRRGKNNEKENHVPVAWLILGIHKEDALEVSYADGDRRNLRRENLITTSRDENPHVQAARAAKAASEATI